MVLERLDKTMKIIRVAGTQKGRSPSRKLTCVTAARASSVNIEVAGSYNYLVRVLTCTYWVTHFLKTNFQSDSCLT